MIYSRGLRHSADPHSIATWRGLKERQGNSSKILVLIWTILQPFMSTLWGLGDLPNASSRGNLFMSVLCETMIIAGRFWYLFGCILEQFLTLFGDPETFQPRVRERTDFRSILTRFWTSPGNPLGSHVGPRWTPETLQSYFFLLFAFSLEPSLFSRLLERLADPLEARLEPFWAWFWEVFRSQNECQHRPRR